MRLLCLTLLHKYLSRCLMKINTNHKPRLGWSEMYLLEHAHYTPLTTSPHGLTYMANRTETAFPWQFRQQSSHALLALNV